MSAVIMSIEQPDSAQRTEMPPDSPSERVATQSSLDHTFYLSRGHHVRDTAPILFETSLRSLYEKFKTPDTGRGKLSFAEYHALRKDVPEEKEQRDREKDGPYIIGACIKPGSRAEDDIVGITSFVCDLDSGRTTKSDIQRKLAGVACLAYTSYSHRLQSEKWRIVIPYREALTKEAHEYLYRHFNDRFAGDLDPCCAKPAQVYYTPACPHDAAHAYECFMQDGELFDAAALLDSSDLAQPAAGSVSGATNLPANSSPTGATVANEAPGAWDPMRPCKDGERTDHLLKLSGSLFARGYDLEQVISFCRAWNEQNTEQLLDEKIVSTCESIAQREAANHPDRQRKRVDLMQDEGPLVPLFGPADARIDTFLTSTPPRRRWLLKDFLPCGIVGAVVAPGGSGKSQFTMQLAYSIASGAPLANHWEVGDQGTVLMLCAEDDTEEIHRRLFRIHEQLSLAEPPTFAKRVMSRLLVRSTVGEDLLLTRKDAGGEVRRTRTLERLGLTAQQFEDLKLIILDPASRFRGGEENSNEDATRFVEALEWLKKETGATVLIAHHTNKQSINAAEINQSAARGASAFTDGIRWALALSAASPKKEWKGAFPENEKGKYLEAKLVKTNYTAPQPAVLLRRLDGGYLQVVNGRAPRSPADEAYAKLLVVLRDQGPLTARQIEDHHCGPNGTLGVSQKAVRKLIDAAAADGLLFKKPREPLELTATGLDVAKSLATDGAGAAPRRDAARRKKTP